jgi:hypothetical protein
MEPAQLRRLKELAEQNPQLRNLLRLDAQPTENELMKRAALAPAFNEELYQDVVCDGIEDPLDFKEFIELPDVERVPYTDGQFWIRETARTGYLSQWLDKSQMTKWSRRMAEFYPAEATPHTLWQMFRRGTARGQKRSNTGNKLSVWPETTTLTRRSRGYSAA